MNIASMRAHITALETQLKDRDETIRQALARISALEVLTSHLRPKHPVREPVPGPGPSDPPRKRAANTRGPNGVPASGCISCGKLLCNFHSPRCEWAKQAATRRRTRTPRTGI